MWTVMACGGYVTKWSKEGFRTKFVGLTKPEILFNFEKPRIPPILIPTHFNFHSFLTILCR